MQEKNLQLNSLTMHLTRLFTLLGMLLGTGALALPADLAADGTFGKRADVDADGTFGRRADVAADGTFGRRADLDGTFGN